MSVVKLPTAATSYYTVRRYRGTFWAVELVTPAPGKAIRTQIVAFSDLAAALDEGRATAQRMRRPFREPRRAV